MPDELLPPDPSKDGWYWVKQSDVGPAPWQWLSGHREWAVAAWTITPEEAARIAALASPHPIPGPERLEELYRDAATTAAFRAALGAKP